MGTYRANNGTWYVNKSWTDKSGKRHFKTKRGFKYKKEAQKYEAELILQIEQKIDINTNPIFANYFDKWIETYKGTKDNLKNSLRPNTLNEYLIHSKHVHTYFGKLRIKDITHSDYQDFINFFGRDHSEITVKKIHNHMRACVLFAFNEGIIPTDFTQYTTLTYNPANARKVTYLEDYQLKLLLSYLINHRDPHYSSTYMIIAIMYTGLRESEAAGLTWDCVDFKKHTLTIDKSWDYKNKSYGPTKNKSSQRIIGMSQKLAEILKELCPNHPSKVFWSRTYKTLPQSHSLIDTLRRALKALKIDAPGIHIHSLRHSQVAILLSADINVYDIAKRLGHSDIATTQRIYAYEFKKHQAQVNQKINEALDAF